ncbi:MAG: DUF3656 domain-containing U32 family peptidase [Oscillospiraceae bacterium]|jgi:putative protease
MPELISPASSPEAAIAAVQSGADAVCLTPVLISEGEQMSGNTGFTAANLKTAATYCRIRGIKTYLELDGLPADGDLIKYEKLIRYACRLGMDAIIVSDLGLARMVQQIAPDMPLHSGRKLNVHNLSAVRTLKNLGFKRVTLAPELEKRQIDFIALSKEDVELAISVHGPVCMAFGGLCNMASMVDGADSAAFECTGRCSRPHGYGSLANEYPLMLKELCLLDRVTELKRLAALRIESVRSRPEYIAAVTHCYRKALDDNPDPGCKEVLARLSSRGGLREGGYAGERGGNVIGTATEPDAELLKRFRSMYRHGERQCIKVQFFAQARRGEPFQLAVQDEEGRTFRETGPVPERVPGQGMPPAQVRTALYNLQDTPYICTGAKVHVQSGLQLTIDQIMETRDRLLETLAEARSEALPKREEEIHPGLKYVNRKERPIVTVSVTRAAQLSPDLLALRPAIIYIPLSEFSSAPERIRPFLNRGADICVRFPDIIYDSELPGVRLELLGAYKMGVRQALISNVGHIELANYCGFEVIRADWGLHARNSGDLRELKQMGFKSAAVSFDLSARQIRELSKSIDCEMLVYGRVPLMVTDICIIKNRAGGRCACDSPAHVTDGEAGVYPVLRTEGCRNTVFSAAKLFLGNRVASYQKLGLWAARLSFTTENARECVQTLERYTRGSNYEPNGHNTGRYFPEDDEYRRRLFDWKKRK